MEDDKHASGRINPLKFIPVKRDENAPTLADAKIRYENGVKIYVLPPYGVPQANSRWRGCGSSSNSHLCDS